MMDSQLRSLAKAISWRIVGSLDTFIIGWIITGTLTIAASIAVTELITKIAIYWAHERVWNTVQWGKND